MAVFVVGPYVHSIDPIIASIFGVHLWWYGLSYSLGFLNAHLFVRRRRGQFGLSARSVYDLSLLLAGGVLLGGRLVEVLLYEWPFYREHLRLIPAFWLGGMATHGLLIGGLVGIAFFCRIHFKSFLSVTDALAIPTAFILGLGRIGNFIDGQIVGSVTSVWWAVKFPDAEGFRHPVVLYDGMKNLLIIPVLWYAAKRRLPTGTLTGICLFLYAFLRIFVDIFREYSTSFLGLATGQALNIMMSVLGLILIVVALQRRQGPVEAVGARATTAEGNRLSGGIGWRRLLFSSLLLFSLVIPSDWTQDVPARYGGRHKGLGYSVIYPSIDTSPESAQPKPHSRQAPNRPMRPSVHVAPSQGLESTSCSSKLERKSRASSARSVGTQIVAPSTLLKKPPPNWPRGKRFSPPSP